MLLKPVKKNVFDVFVGTGWDGWSRFEMRGTYLKKLAGDNLSPYNMALLKERVYGK